MAQSEQDVILFLVGNKKDKEEEREVTLDRVEKFKSDRGIMFHFETSAKTGENIENLFIFASKVLYDFNKDKIDQMVSSFEHNFQREEAMKKKKSRKKLHQASNKDDAEGQAKKKGCCM